MEEKRGSSGAVVLVGESEVTKTGSAQQIEAELAAYERLYRLLGDRAVSVAAVWDFNAEGQKASFKMERLPRQLEELIQSAGEDEQAMTRVWEIVARVIDLLEQWRQMPTAEDPDLLLRELEQAGDDAWRRAGSDQEMCDWLTIQKLLVAPVVRRRLLQGLALTPCHRDFCTNNVGLTLDGGVKIFDPRWSLTGSEVSSSGHIIIDLASLRINLERLQSDRVKKSFFGILPVSLVDGYVEKLIRQGVVSEGLRDLVWLRRYLGFVACRCGHCLAPERLHRFRLMRQRAGKVSRRLINELQKCLAT